MKIHHTVLGVCDTYEVVTEPPRGYIIWNIGDNAPEGYLPFCKLKFMQPFEGGREIEPDTLKAMKCDGARNLSRHRTGCRNLRRDEEVHQEARTQPRKSWECERMRAAIPYLEKIGM